MFGGVQAVTWTDVKIMVLIVFGLFAVIATALIGLPAGVGLGRRPEHRRRDRPAADVRLLVRPDQPVHLLVGDDRRALPLLLVLRHRSEPGAAIPDGAFGRRSTALAADERLLEDSAAAPGAAPRRARVRLLRLHAAAAPLQRGTSRAPQSRQRRAGVRGARSRVQDRVRRQASGRGRTGGGPRRGRRHGSKPARKWCGRATPP